jgi:hypothetical protein
MADPWKGFADSLVTFGRVGATITPGATDLDPVPKGIVCLADGNVTVVPVDNADAATLTFTGCTVGFIPPFRVRRVTAATGTWATIS